MASFNFLELDTHELSGDIHPQPGPDSQLSIPVRITQRSHRQKNSHLSCNHSTSTRIILKTMPTRRSSLMTINTTSSSIRNMENQYVSSAAYHTHRSHQQKLIRLIVVIPNNLITIQRLPLKASNARHMSMCLLNVRSINNKALFIKDYVVDHHGWLTSWGLLKLGPNQMENPIVLWMSWVPGDILLRCVSYKFPYMSSRVICKLVINDILMSFFTLWSAQTSDV